MLIYSLYVSVWLHLLLKYFHLHFTYSLQVRSIFLACLCFEKLYVKQKVFLAITEVVKDYCTVGDVSFMHQKQMFV